MAYWIGATALLLLLFWLTYRHNKASLLSGFLFSLFLLVAGALVLAGLAYWASDFAFILVTIFGVLALAVLLFGGYALILYLFANARTIAKKEGRSLATSLTLVLALTLTALTVASIFIDAARLPAWARYIGQGLFAVAVFYFIHVLVFLLTSMLCNLARPKYNQDYIIILGSGLIDGKAPPLLGSRIDRAIAFYTRQKQAGQPPPKLVMSGGQGADEPVSEASAMRLYARGKDIPDSDIIMEDRATNTLENLLFSKLLMDRDSSGRPYKCIYATSRYHLLRAGIYARRAGLNIDGIGARTARYYVPNALIREYIAFLALHKRRFILIAVLIFILTLVFFFGLDYITAHYVLPA